MAKRPLSTKRRAASRPTRRKPMRSKSAKRAQVSRRSRQSRRDQTRSPGDPLAQPQEPDRTPSSPGIDWVAETNRADELPSEQLEIPAAKKEALRQMLGEEVLISATSGDDAAEEIHEEVVPEEFGGPFVETRAKVEFDKKPDAANPDDAEREPLPRAVSDAEQTPSD